MPAAMVAATASGALAVAAPLLADAGREAPRQALLAIHRAISRIGTHAMSCYTLLLARDGSMSYANAGHCFPYVLPAAAGPGGRALKVLAAASNPLGLGAFEIREGECRLDAGDTVVFTTDGIEDRIGKDGARFGLRRFRTLLRGSSNAHDIVALRDEIVAEVEQFAAGAPKDDDMTLVVLRLGAAGAAPGGAVA
jgi:serine phosphatase RsbU (regulator of sigma subunit)